MTDQETTSDNRPFWQLFNKDLSEHTAVLSAFRRGISKEPGEVPEMWPFYRELQESGFLTRKLRAEHLTMVLFAIHQQSASYKVHRGDVEEAPGVSIATALRKLRDNDKFSKEALDKRFMRAVTNTDVTRMVLHLQGLIKQLKAAKLELPLNYDLLFRDLKDWQDPLRIASVKRRWAGQYYGKSTQNKTEKAETAK
ncbi:MAG: type I-E CRISPR-associated protein Cse2/CasB [Actinomycetaceae bacterium]|nr:type I-E CRISPR-associated protein Cse2/CasB [Actinomycetaceae bacterium]